jgi:hypothetical protein
MFIPFGNPIVWGCAPIPADPQIADRTFYCQSTFQRRQSEYRLPSRIVCDSSVLLDAPHCSE